MAQNSHIEWTDSTWNPITGCTKISTGCKNCYAERMAKRLFAMGNPRYKNKFDVTLHNDLIEKPLEWKKPRMIFVNSMSDLFHKDVSIKFIKDVFEVMKKADHHIFQVLTKRSKRLVELAPHLPWPNNVWIGVSVENQQTVSRIDDLRMIPSKIRFLSVEPLLGSINSMSLEGIHWVVVGGESGPNSRPLKKEWVRTIRDNCTINGTSFFFKQWGGTNKKKTGRELDGKHWNEMPTDSIPHQLNV